jgi:hypothetical protein
MNAKHLSTATIVAMVENELAVFERRQAEEHAASCAGCARALELARSLDENARQLPREIAPPPEVWHAVRETVAQRARKGGGYRPLVSLWRFAGSSERRWLAAAALLLVAVTAGVTSLVVGSPVRSADPETELARSSTGVVIPASVRAVERDLAASVENLERALADRRPMMLPETAATVEHSLAIIDDAIAEARAALARDPANHALVDALTRGYSTKIDLLKRATELEPRT